MTSDVSHPTIVGETDFAGPIGVGIGSGGRVATAYPVRDPCRGVAANADAESDLELRLVARLRSQGRHRYELSVLASWFVERQGWEPLGFARLGDYAGERLGRSARSVNDFAHVGVALRQLPAVRLALIDGTLSWTKVRLVVRVAQPHDELRWLAFARSVSAEVLSREVRRVDRGSLEVGGLEADCSPSSYVDISCSRETRALWQEAGNAACRSAGAMLHPSARTELILAEVHSALSLADEDTATEPSAIEPPSADPGNGARPFRFARTRGSSLPDDGALWPAFREASGESAHSRPDRSDAAELFCAEFASGPRALDEVDRLRDVESADAFELDRRLCEGVAVEQKLCAEVGPLLQHVFRRSLHRLLGYQTRDAYARERLGMDASWCRLLLRVERGAHRSPAFARSYRAGELTALQAASLVPLIVADLDEKHVARWVGWAREVTLRRLRDDIDDALTLREIDCTRWIRHGALPGDANQDDPPSPNAAWPPPRESSDPLVVLALEQSRELAEPDPEAGDGESVDREIRARSTAPMESANIGMFLDVDVARLLRATLCSLRRRLGRVNGRLPTEGEALGVIAAHVLATWNNRDPKRRRDDTIFARDGWRCAVPGCSSMRSLHAHHIQYRSRGGSDDPSNLITLCAFHHQRGVHGGTVRCSGRAPHALRFGLGVRGSKTLLEYRSGDRRVG